MEQCGVETMTMKGVVRSEGKSDSEKTGRKRKGMLTTPIRY